MTAESLVPILQLFAAFLAISCVYGLIFPKRMVSWVDRIWNKQFTLYLAVLVRVLLGLLFIFVAPETKFPTTFLVLGYFMLAAAVIIGILGRQKIGLLLAWFKALPERCIRLWLFAGLLFGGFLLYGAR